MIGSRHRRYSPALLAAFLIAIATSAVVYARSAGTVGEFGSPTVTLAADRPIVEFLILLPFAAVVCSFVRNVVGKPTFGTFAPALLGLSFRDATSVQGLFLLLIILTIGWLVRHGIAGWNLLQIPRSAFLLSITAAFLLLYVFLQNAHGRSAATVVPLLPLVIMTSLIERFWSAEEEDGTRSATITFANTAGTAGLIFGLSCWTTVREWVVSHPESIGYAASTALLIGRYTGLRWTEFRRFRSIGTAASDATDDRR